MSDTDGFRIVRFRAENIKRLKVVTIEPTGSVVEITGDNDQGKSSTLDALWWLFTGAKNAQAVPIRDGEEEATIFADMGTLKVTRTFKRKAEGDRVKYPTSLVIENVDGAHYPTPQKMLDAMIGALAMDPLEFTRLKPNEKFDALRRFVPGFDFDEAEKADRIDYEARTAANRQAKEAKAQSEAIHLPTGLPDARVDEDAIVQELADVSKVATEIEQRKARRLEAQRKIDDLREMALAARMAAEDYRQKALDCEVNAERHVERATEMVERLAAADPLPDLPDTAEIRTRLAKAKDVNAWLDAAARKAALDDRVKSFEVKATGCTASMDRRAEDKRRAIAAASLPIDGIGFGDRSVLLNGLPFEQASSSQQLRTSIAIAMASNPKLRVMRITEGSLLDAKGFEVVRSMAEKAGWQVWMEVVDSRRDAAIVIQDGQVKRR